MTQGRDSNFSNQYLIPTYQKKSAYLQQVGRKTLLAENSVSAVLTTYQALISQHSFYPFRKEEFL